MSPGGTVEEHDRRLRLFLALRIPAPVRRVVADWAGSELRDAGRVLGQEHLHVTLAFLGSRPATELQAIVEALRAAAAGARRIELAPARWRETRSVGMVTLHDRDGAAGALASDLHGRLERLGVYRREARPWLAHLTVLRFRVRPGLQPSLPELKPFVPSDAAAYVSRLHPSGARYEVLASTPLGG